MRLISLTSNRPTFRPIYFNRTGITLILGKQKSAAAGPKGRTYNGVGKSLAVSLVHYCLGSNSVKEFERAMPDWEFSLEFEAGGKSFTSTRNTSRQKTIVLNGEEMGVKKFRRIMEEIAFYLSEPRPYLTFRALLSRFVRPKKASYVTFDLAEAKETPYQRLVLTSYLLGLNVNLVENKRNLVVARDQIKEFRNNLEKDTVFLEFFTGFKDVEIELIDLDERVTALERDIASFRIAENYHQVQVEANDLQRRLQQVRNRVVVIQNAVKNIDRSLEAKVDIPIDRVLQLYSEAATVMPGAAIKKMEEVVAFHKQLMHQRIVRLSSERARLEAEQRQLDVKIANLSHELNNKFEFLGEHGALEEYARMSSLLGDLKSKAQKLRDYKDLLAKYSDQIREISAALVSESEKTSKYLAEAEPLVNTNLLVFRSFSRRFYPDKPGGLTVVNNEGENQLRFDIHARIQDDASDGINEVKIFCFDMTVLSTRHNHNVEFLFHDSRLFSDVDHRQRAILFRIADEQARANDVQYIATVNEDQIVAMKDQFTEEEYKAIFTSNVVLELTDESPSEKLLGVEVDMHYE